MDRKEEYQALLNELEDTPPALESTVGRARAKNRKRRLGRFCGIPAASLAGAAAAFVLLVNCSAPFARACGTVPFLKDLALAAAFSPSLKAAVEHDYVQPMGQSQTVNGVTATVEYVIVDMKQVNVFYTLEGGEGRQFYGIPTFLNSDGSQTQAAVSWGDPEPEGPRKVTVDFTQGDVPDTLVLDLSVRRAESHSEPVAGEPPAPLTENALSGDNGPVEEPETVAEFSFTLRFDPGYTETGTIYELNAPIELDGQRLTVARVEIYPTHIRLELEDDPDNTAWLKDLQFYLEDEDGNRYEPISNGLSATGDPAGTPFMPSHRLESSYFGDAEQLTVRITGATWLDKDKEYLELDIENGTLETPPEGVSLGRVWRSGDNVNVVLANLPEANGGIYSVHYDGWLDPEGTKHEINSSSCGSAFEKDGEYLGAPIPAGHFYESFTLRDCPWDTVLLGVGFSRYSTFDTPVSIKVK